jgi:ABC-2 type transport system ATP-binding protein
VIEIDRLTFRYPGADADALGELSLTVREGGLFGLLGPNGSGKTTLVSILSGILPAPRGRVRVGGEDLAANTARIQSFSSLVPQEYAFYPRLTVVENLRFFAGVQSIPTGEVRSRMDEVLEISGLQDARRRRAEHFSGGMKRRLNFAIGMLNRPRLLFLDEPTVGIDPQSRAFILESVKRVNRQGTTVIYTSHYMEEVEALCDEIGVLDHGHLLVQGSLASLLAGSGGNRARGSFAAPLDAPQRAALAAVPGIELRDGEWSVERCTESDFHRLLELFRDRRIALRNVQFGHGNLEELFLHMTHRSLRD